MRFREVLLPNKLDLDVMGVAWLFGIAADDNVRFISGSATGEELADPNVLCVEVGGAGRTAENNFDHHAGAQGNTQTQLSAAAQVLERVARLFRYIDDVDRGELSRVAKIGFPSLLQLVSGMQLVVKDPKLILQHGKEILGAVIRSGINPYEESMEKILDLVPGARAWAAAKLTHERQGEEVIRCARWLTTSAGRKLAVIETTWIGAPGALYGHGADIVVALNPSMELGGGTIRKFTIASQKEKGISVRPVLEALEAMETLESGEGGWGGPNHGTIIGSPQHRSSSLTIEAVLRTVVEKL